jgi:hypothetical protein
MCLQEPGLMDLPGPHIQYKCNSGGGWGASIIVHERFANRVTFNTCGTNWVVIGLDFSDLGWKDIGFVSAHLPPSKKKEVDDAEYRGTIVEIDAAILALKQQMQGIRLFEGMDANTELPNLDDAVFNLTGSLCNNHGTTSRSWDFLEHLHKHGLRACNTFPTERHPEHNKSWACLGTRKELRLIDYSCFNEDLPFKVCYKEDVNTDHRTIHTAIPLAPADALCKHMTVKTTRTRRKKSKKYGKPDTDVTAEAFRRKLENLSESSSGLESFHTGLTSLVQDTSASTRGHSKPKRPAKSEALVKAEKLVEDATTPLGSVLAARRMMKLRRADEDNFRKLMAEALFGQRTDRKAHKDAKPRHEDHVFSSNSPEAATECIRTYYEDLFNSRGWTVDEYRCWFQVTERYLSGSAHFWDKLHPPISTLIDCWRGVKNGKAPGRDGITNEVMAFFNWETLCRLRELFEKRLNNEEGGEPGPGWLDIDIQCLPKKKKPMNLGEWRPISLLSTIQKLYNAVVAKMYDGWIELPSWMAGFMEGRQTVELSFAVQQAFEKSTVPGQGCWVAKLDVRKAFDNMDHPEFASLCYRFGINPGLILSTLKEWEGARAIINVAGFESVVTMLAGGRQGGRDTPKLWNILLLLILKDQVQEWEEKDLVWSLQTQGDLSPRLNILAWADDLLVFANSRRELETKLGNLLEVLRDHRLDVKQNSLEWACTFNQHHHDKGDLEIPHRRGQVKFVFRPKGLNILGVWIDPGNDNSTMWKHRLTEAHLSWLGLKAQLCRRRVPLRKRIQRWQSTVGKTLLWGCGAWTMTKEDFLKIQSFQLRCFRHMWGRRARLDELWSHTCIRLTHQIKGMLKKWNIELIADTALGMYHSWAGHAARLPKAHFLHDLLRFMAVTDKGMRKAWGRPKDWDVKIKNSLGSDWWTFTTDREKWKGLGRNFVNGRCEEFGQADPEERRKDLPPRWTANFFALMGSPVLGSFQGRTLMLVGTHRRTVELVLG